MKSKIIIHKEHASLTDEDAIAYAYSVIRDGKKGKTYKRVSFFRRAEVSVSLSQAGTHIFKIKRPWNRRKR